MGEIRDCMVGPCDVEQMASVCLSKLQESWFALLLSDIPGQELWKMLSTLTS